MKMKLTFQLLLALLPLLGQSQELQIYGLNAFDRNTGQRVGFISLSEAYQWSGNAEAFISEEYLGYSQAEDRNYAEHRNYHELKPETRSRFLEGVGISEADSIYIYYVLLDTIRSYKVGDQPIIAILDFYTTQPPFREYDYQIGIETEDMSATEHVDYYTNVLVYIGKENPFLRGKTQPIVWEKVDNELFPLDKNMPDSAQRQTYIFATAAHHYFVQDIGSTNRANERHVVVVDAENDRIIFNEIYNDSESTFLLPLNGFNEYGDGITQWTGKVFKDKPPIITGFLGHSFGCPYLAYLDESAGAVPINCDNRH